MSVAHDDMSVLKDVEKGEKPLPGVHYTVKAGGVPTAGDPVDY